jgi:hypothetical protein
MNRQDVNTCCESIARHNENQHATRFEPPIRVLKEQPFHPFIPSLRDLKVIRRILKYAREGFHRTMRIEGVTVNHRIQHALGLFCPIRIQLDSVANGLCTLGDYRERRARAGAGIEHARGRPIRIPNQKFPDSFSFPPCQRIISELLSCN